MIKSSYGNTPLPLTYGTEAVIPAEIRMPTYRTAVVATIHNNEQLRLNLDLLEERRECVAIREAKAKLKMTKYYNIRVRGVTFRPEDFVYRNNKASHAMDGGKLGLKWEGPYQVYGRDFPSADVERRQSQEILSLSNGMEEFALQLGLVIKYSMYFFLFVF
nr:reverse transcriptase domain-containing protein [Tanacetum cinerariifolium]